jgi:hypothetical protein
MISMQLLSAQRSNAAFFSLLMDGSWTRAFDFFTADFEKNCRRPRTIATKCCKPKHSANSVTTALALYLKWARQHPWNEAKRETRTEYDVTSPILGKAPAPLLPNSPIPHFGYVWFTGRRNRKKTHNRRSTIFHLFHYNNWQPERKFETAD